MIDPDSHIFGVTCLDYDLACFMGWLSRKPGHWARMIVLHHEHRNRENLTPKPSTSIKSTECQIRGSGASSKCERWKERNSRNIEFEFGCLFKGVMIWWVCSDGFWMTWETGPLCAPWTVRFLPPWFCLWVFSDIWKKSSSSMACDS